MNEQDLNQLLDVVALLRPGQLLLVLAGVAVLAMVARVLRRSGEQLARRFPARRPLVLQSTNLAVFLVYVFGGTVLFFGVLAPPRELMIAVAGGLAVAVGLSLKDIVASLVAGVILLFDRPFNVGDRISFDGIYGEITAIGLRAVRLQTLDDNTVTIPNAKFITDAVASGNFGQLTMMITVDFHLDPRADLALARRVAHEAVVTSRYAFVRHPVTTVLEQRFFDDTLAVRLTVKAYVIDVVFEKAFQSDIVERVSEAFGEYGIPWAGGGNRHDG